MGQSLTQVYVHIVFSTKNRKNLIDDNIEERLFEYIGGICKNMKCNPLSVGGYRNHVHVLCLLPKNITQTSLLEEIKKRSSKWIKKQGALYSNFYWQNGYGIFSVDYRKLDVVIRYIENQKEHHTRKTFREEFISHLKENGVDYDPRYVWD